MVSRQPKAFNQPQKKPKIESIPIWRVVKKYMESEEGYKEILKECAKRTNQPTDIDLNQAALEILKKFISILGD